MEAQIAICIVIPSYKEPSLLPTLNSLNQNPHCEKVEVIIVFNSTSKLKEDYTNYPPYIELQGKQFKFRLHTVNIPTLPPKVAGVGMARKIGMDEAYHRFESIEKNGVIVGLDADCEVANNYVEVIMDFFNENPKLDAASIHYEHPLPFNTIRKDAIILYELHLRYHIDFQKYIGLPFAFQTVGSSMAVRSKAYWKQGGMNKRKAGEDFYFIQKYAAINKLGEIKNTTVFPEARFSDRVPFGTGKAIVDFAKSGHFETYNPKSYLALQPFMQQIELLYAKDLKLAAMNLSASLTTYLESQDFDATVEKLKLNASSYENFHKAFFQYFNAFRLMKYLHFARDEEFPNVSMLEGAKYLHELLTRQYKDWSLLEYLEFYREWDRSLVD